MNQNSYSMTYDKLDALPFIFYKKFKKVVRGGYI